MSNAARVELAIDGEADVSTADAVAAALRTAIAGAADGAGFIIEFSCAAPSLVAVQLGEACRKSLLAAGRPGALGPMAAAILPDGGNNQERAT